jgi:hypothetical protein
VTVPTAEPTGYPSDATSKSAAAAADALAVSPTSGLEMIQIDAAIAALSGKQGELSHFFDYYAGTAVVPLVSDRLQEIYRNLTFVIAENWSAVVVDSTTDRIELMGAKGGDDAITAELKAIIDEVELLVEADEAHQAAIVGGEAYIIAWKDPETDELECYYNDPRTCHIFYEANRPNVPRLAVKWWDGDDDGMRHIKFYTKAHITEITMPFKKEGQLNTAELEQVSHDENPFGIIPMFHLRTKRRKSQSDLSNVMPIQDGINILLINMMVTAEFSAAPMKYVISNAEGIEDLVVAPNRIWNIPAGDGLPGTTGTTVGQFAASDLTNYLAAIAHGIDAISAISRTPRHYFYGSQLPPSGEALKTMEGPLVKKVRDRLQRFTPTWERLIAFLYLLKTGKKIELATITILWADPETVQPQQAAQTETARAQAITAKEALGVSPQQGLRELGYTDDVIAKMQEEHAAWAESQAGTLEAIRLELETARAQLGLALVQAATLRGALGVTAGQLLKELGYTEEEATLMLGDKAHAPPAQPEKGAGGPPPNFAPKVPNGAVPVMPPPVKVTPIPAGAVTTAPLAAAANLVNAGEKSAQPTPVRNGTATNKQESRKG